MKTTRTALAALFAVTSLLAACTGETYPEASGMTPEGATARTAQAVTGRGAGMAASRVTLKGRKLMLDGAPYQVRGVDYAPIPIGSSADAFYGDGNREGDGGDVFGNPYFEEQLRRDVAAMRDMGVNTIRVYQMHPWDPQKGPGSESVRARAHQKFLDMLWNGGDRPIRAYVAFPVSSDITRYTTVANKPTDGRWFREVPVGGSMMYEIEDETRVSNGWAFNGAQTAAQRRATDMAAYEALAKEVGNHPAVLGFVLSNELNGASNRENPRFFQFMNELGGKLKAIAPEKHTIMALIDDGNDTLRNVKAKGFDVSNIDAWGINSYRGRIGETTNHFDNLFTSYAELSEKPLVVTEFGAPATTRVEIKNQFPLPVPSGAVGALNNLCPSASMIDMPDNAKLQADYIEGHWKHIDANKDIVSGGLVFEWQDEYFKAGAHLSPRVPPSADPHAGNGQSDLWHQSPSPSGVDAFPGGCWDEEGFGINAVSNKRGGQSWPGPFIPDGRSPRAAFDRLKVIWTQK
ncbi:MAG: hypothetical protein JST00_26600 [Deltaproteobacteria bacterium]|nr:hypothetical protein [Deltaproteobacteria bacterium]